MKEKRSIITIDVHGNIAMPADTGSIAMTEWELCELFGVVAPDVYKRQIAPLSFKLLGFKSLLRTALLMQVLMISNFFHVTKN